MTFRHGKFEDSVVMRSLQKVAKDKGWVVDEPIKKTASLEVDLSATDDFVQNILKLCSGLRVRGFDKYADELEEKFVVYKQAAATLYDAFNGETGDDLVGAAHPKGSHHLEDVDGNEAVVETILDQQAKMLTMINKKPTGKLASSNDVLEAVKVALGARPLVVSKSKTSLGAPPIFEPGVGWTEPPVSAAGIATRTAPIFEPGVGWTEQPPVSILSNIGESAAGIVTRTAPMVGATGVSGLSLGGLIAALASWPVVLSGLVGGFAGWQIAKRQFYAPELEKAGNNLLSEVADVAQDTVIQSKSLAFSVALKAAVANAKESLEFLASPKPEISDTMENFPNSLQAASQAASNLMTLARSKISPSNIAPGQSIKTHWYDNVVMPFTETSAYRDIEISASNFIDVAQKANVAARAAINKAMQLAQEALQEQIAKSGGPVTTSLTKKIEQSLAAIKQYQAIITNKKSSLKNGDKLLQALSKLNEEITAQQKAYVAACAGQDTAVLSQIAQTYTDKVTPYINMLNYFYKTWIVK